MVRNKCIICECAEDTSINAGFKAPSDVLSILKSDGFSTFNINYISLSRWYRPVLIPYYAIQLAYCLRHCNVALFQHPGDTFHNALRVINSLAFLIAGKKCAKKIALVHDINTIRFHYHGVRQEMQTLALYDGVIVHSQEMASLLKEHGNKKPISILGLFDYLVSKPFNGKRSFGFDVVFAGNLAKSEFLKHIAHSTDGVQYLLYGSKPDTEFEISGLLYKGRFSPDDLTSIEGNWGLVWDGNSTQECSGHLGEYLKYNSPHKASLYVCAKLPLIVPEKSAVAALVKKYNIGIVVNSLDNLKDAISSISLSEYDMMQSNLQIMSESLMSGRNLLSAIDKLI